MSLLIPGQILRGKRGIYSHQITTGICLARNVRSSCDLEKDPTDGICRNQNKRKVIVKSVEHFRLQNERHFLRRFQNQTPFIRPLLDETQEFSISEALFTRALLMLNKAILVGHLFFEALKHIFKWGGRLQLISGLLVQW